MTRTVSLALLAVAVGLSSGCVTRRVVITSSPPGAIVFRDGQPIGATPVEQPFVYYGKYRYRLVADGFAPKDVEPDFDTPWYQYPGIDFLAENLWPFTVRDVQQVHVDLERLEPMRNDDLRGASEALRGRASAIGSPVPKERPARPTPAPVTNNAPPAEKPPADEALPAPKSPKREPAGNTGFQTAPARREAVSPPPGGATR